MAMPGFSRRKRSIVRSTVAVVFATGMGYVAGALVHGTFASSDASAAIAQPIQAAQPEPASSAFGPRDFEWTRSIVEFVEAPRECDATRGPTAECIFMD